MNTEDSDLELFFKEIEKIAQGNAQQNLLNIAKDELKKICPNYKAYWYDNLMDMQL